MITNASTMAEVLDGLSIGDDSACYEFVRRQRSESLAALSAGAKRLGDAAFDLQLRQPDTLMAWKYPEVLNRVTLDQLQNVLTEASEGADTAALRTALTGLPFAELITISSLAGRLRAYSERTLARGPLQSVRAPDPQLNLLPQEPTDG